MCTTAMATCTNMLMSTVAGKLQFLNDDYSKSSAKRSGQHEARASVGRQCVPRKAAVIRMQARPSCMHSVGIEFESWNCASDQWKASKRHKLTSDERLRWLCPWLIPNSLCICNYQIGL